MTSIYKAASPALLLCLSIAAAPPAAAGPDTAPRAGTWFTQTGAVIIDYRHKSEVTLNGAPAAGAAANPNNDLTLGSGYGYYLTDNISVMAVLGVGPETSVVDNAGTRLGKMWYGAPSLVFDYHFTGMGALQPFVGIGASYILVLDETDGFIQDLHIDSSLGLVVRAGAELMLDRNFGVFFTANKIFVDTDARGVVDGTPFGSPGVLLPIAAKIDLDPFVYQGGFTFRY